MDIFSEIVDNTRWNVNVFICSLLVAISKNVHARTLNPETSLTLGQHVAWTASTGQHDEARSKLLHGT
jgi:hypothetical protein